MHLYSFSVIRNQEMGKKILIFLLLVTLIPSSISQTPTPTPPVCNGISISYIHNLGYQIPPSLLPSDPTHQPYRFESTLTVTNNGVDELKSWRVFVGFNNSDLLVSATNAVLADGTSFPANVSNGAVLTGFPVTDLKTAIETAGDINQMQARVDLVGTQFGVAPPAVPLPHNLSLINDGFACSPTLTITTNVTNVCCIIDANARFNLTTVEAFLPRQDGDITIMYDVTSAYESRYFAQVTISNHNPLTRLDNWQLSWDWMREEFISSMKGAYPTVIDTNGCIFGKQSQFYKDFDFSNVLNCERSPTIIDLPIDKANDSNLGSVPFCCRNGTILSPYMDPSKSKSVLVMEVFKMPPDINRTKLIPPQNWKINNTFNSDYQCGPPMRVDPTLFPDPNGLNSETSAVASWQVVCNITQTKPRPAKCCVSFSAYFNESISPCNTCACGCNVTESKTETCSATTPALLLPSQALLVPFDNRTKLASEHYKTKKWAIPNPLPCGDNCGVTINWHLLSDYKDGWAARMTVFNWDELNVIDWFAAVELEEKSMAGFEKVYSFNGSALTGSNTTMYIQGLPDFNYIVGERNGKNPKKDPRVPGSQQSVISFTKKNINGVLNVARGDGFPVKVYFNGEECSLPIMLPSNAHITSGAEAIIFSSILALFIFIFLSI